MHEQEGVNGRVRGLGEATRVVSAACITGSWTLPVLGGGSRSARRGAQRQPRLPPAGAARSVGGARPGPAAHVPAPRLTLPARLLLAGLGGARHLRAP